IGEHTDYNDGFVLPCAIDRDTLVGASGRDDRLMRIYSRNLNASAEFNLDEPPHPQGWARYVKGMARALESRGMRLRGADIAIQSEVPVCAGLSSSSALEISVGLAFVTLSHQHIEPRELALSGQQAEHTYAGVMSGIMDQMTAVLGRAGTALLIDCRSLETAYIPLDATKMATVICDSRVKHELGSSEYNVRRAACQRGVELLSKALPGIRAVRDVTPEAFRRL